MQARVGKPSQSCQQFPGARNPLFCRVWGRQPGGRLVHLPAGEGGRQGPSLAGCRRCTQDGSTEAAGPGLGPALLDGVGGARGLRASGETWWDPRPTGGARGRVRQGRGRPLTRARRG